MEGTFYVVGTPIGNLEDITFRAIRILKEVDEILCENYKNSRKLLEHYSIKTTAKTYYKDISEKPYSFLIELIKKGKNYAFISDAGMPGISDPISHLIRILKRHNIKIAPIPGISALSTIMSVAGVQTNPCIYLGFLSVKKSKKKRQLEQIIDHQGIGVLFESCHRLESTVELIFNILKNIEIFIGKEMTKKHENFIYVSSLEDFRSTQINLKGEFTILINFKKNI